MADRLLTIGALEKTAALSEFVDVGSNCEFRPVATELGAEIIDSDEEDVRLLLGQ